MSENDSGRDEGAPPRNGVNDHAWEREHRHPTAEQAKAIVYRRRDAEAKLRQHQQEARQKADEESEEHHE
ncbi:hypothetical protein [Arthrobacter zhaoguopingii]|uniref:hypothetical protein n=1 Tax=Arthrobacter zhaoguopingii TaxID=2681491 RepID=UPI00135965DD|nr:hypothetical protein [Arthrobacter zhaoguopingii]